MRALVLISFFLVAYAGMAQDMTKFKLYKPEENARQKIESAIEKAKKSGRHVLIQVGGNWCIWCARFNDFVTRDKSIDSLVNANYVVYHLNWSKEIKNSEILEKYSFPQRFGFPVFLILDREGKLLHTQNSWYLEDGAKSYNKEKVESFLNDWTPGAMDPAKYKDQ